MGLILQHVGTSLQLVALFLLLVAGIARLLVRSGKWKASPATTRLVINRVFEAAIAALIIGVASPAVGPVLDRWLNGDQTYRGSVLSDSGDPVPNASVNLITVGTATTNAEGLFEITVPRNRLLKEYKIQVKATGYETPAVLLKSADEMRNIEVRLNRISHQLVKALESPLMIAHFYGVPFVVVTLRVENAGSSTISIADVRGELSSDAGTLILSPATWTILNPLGWFAPMSGPLPIFAGANLDLRVVMMSPANLSSMFNQLGALSEYRSQAPCTQNLTGNVEPLTDKAYDLVRDFADKHFGWREGTWHLKIDVVAENEDKTFTRDFTLTDVDISHLRDSVSLLRQCMAVNTATPLAQDGGLANFVSK